MKDELKYAIISSMYKGLQQYALYKSSGQLDSLCKSIYDDVTKGISLNIDSFRVMSTEIHDAYSNKNLKRILYSINAYCPEDNRCIVDAKDGKMYEICIDDARDIIYSIADDYSSKFNRELVCTTVVLGPPEARGIDADNASLLLHFLIIYTLSPKEKMILNSDNSVKVIDSFLGGIA